MDIRTLGARLVPVALALTLASPFVLPSELNPLVVTVAGTLCAALLAGAATLASTRTLDPSTVAGLVGMAALAGWLTARAIVAADPLMSFVGFVSQHAGAALWVVAAAWLAGTAVLADKGALRQVMAVVAITGGAAGVLTVTEALTGGARAWGSAAGAFENSSSAGSFLAVAVFAAGAWLLAERSATGRGLAGASILASLAGIAAADSRTGAIALVAGAMLVGALSVGRGSTRRRWVLAIAVPLAGVIVTAVLVAAAMGALGASATEAVSLAGTDRDAIWRSAWAQIVQAPLAGSGPEQFSAWVSWGFNGGDVSTNGTYDPHNALLALALGGGLVAVLLWTAAAALILAALISGFERAGRPRALAALIALPVALATASLFAWLTPAAVIATAAVTGCVLGSARAAGATAPAGDPHDTPLVRMALASQRPLAALLAAGAIAVAVTAIPALGPARAFVGGEARGSVDLAALHARWPDPAYASLALSAALAEGARAPQADALLGDVRTQATYHVDLALREVYVAQRAVQADPAEWPRFAAAIELGVQADPASGLWYTLGAAQARVLGRMEESREYAERALGFPLTDADQQYLQGLAAETP